jgi:NAD(P)H dehydrogenase (quinone)
MPRLAVIYYSSTGHVHKLAQAVVAGAEETGAEVRLRRAPEEVVRSQDAWHEHTMATRETCPRPAWRTFSRPTATRSARRRALVCPRPQLKQFLDTTGPLWAKDELANKPVTAFTSSMNRPGGQESTILALNNVFYHWARSSWPPATPTRLLYNSGGNPYGTSLITGQEIAEQLPAEIETAARYQGRRWAARQPARARGRSA